jgi:hypothetical protein
MGKKRADLCERPYCRNPWTQQVSGFQANMHRGWVLRVCEEHAEIYMSPGSSIQVNPREPAPQRSA